MKKLTEFSQEDGLELLKSYAIPSPEYRILKQATVDKIIARDQPSVQSILELYHGRWHGSFVSVSRLNQTQLSGETIRGDANLFAAIDTFGKSEPGTEAVLLMQSHQPAFSGLLYTFQPQTGTKTQFLIATTAGSFGEDPRAFDGASFLTWDIRTDKIVSRETASRPTAGVLKISGTELIRSSADEQIPPLTSLHQLVFIGKRLAQKTFAPLTLHWEIQDGQILIRELAKFDRNTRLESQSSAGSFEPGSSQSKVKTQLIGRGTTINSGLVEGRLTLDSTAAAEIYLTSSISPADLPKLNHFSAVVCTEPVRNGSVVSYLKKHAIPSLSGTGPAQPLLIAAKSGQRVVVDAHAGTVSLQNSSSSPLTDRSQARTEIPIYTWQKNPYFRPTLQAGFADNPDGVVVSYDFLIQLGGKHPLHLIRRSKEQFTFELSETLIQAHHQQPVMAYQTLNLHHDQLSQLQYAPEFPHPLEDEPENPSLGVRGGLQILFQPEIFVAELAAVARASRLLQKDLICLVPFIRSVSELQLALKYLAEVNLQEKTNLSLGLSIGLPIQIHNLPYLLRPGVKLLVIDSGHLHALSLGVDPTSAYLRRHYPLDRSLIKQYLAQVTSQLDRPVPVWLQLDQPNKELATAAKSWGVAAFLTTQNKRAAVAATLQATPLHHSRYTE